MRRSTHAKHLAAVCGAAALALTACTSASESGTGSGTVSTQYAQSSWREGQLGQRTGYDIAWSSEGFGSLAFVGESSDALIVMSCSDNASERRIAAYSAADGSVQWMNPIPGSRCTGADQASAVIIDDIIYVPGVAEKTMTVLDTDVPAGSAFVARIDAKLGSLLGVATGSLAVTGSSDKAGAESNRRTNLARVLGASDGYVVTVHGGALGWYDLASNALTTIDLEADANLEAAVVVPGRVPTATAIQGVPYSSMTVGKISVVVPSRSRLLLYAGVDASPRSLSAQNGTAFAADVVCSAVECAVPVITSKAERRRVQFYSVTAWNATGDPIDATRAIGPAASPRTWVLAKNEANPETDSGELRRVDLRGDVKVATPVAGSHHWVRIETSEGIGRVGLWNDKGDVTVYDPDHGTVTAVSKVEAPVHALSSLGDNAMVVQLRASDSALATPAAAPARFAQISPDGAVADLAGDIPGVWREIGIAATYRTPGLVVMAQGDPSTLVFYAGS